MKLFHRFRDWLSSQRLPVRIPVPNRDNLIAMGLTALAIGLIVGVTLGPNLSGVAGTAIAGVAAQVPGVNTPATDTTDPSTGAESEGVALGAPTPGTSSGTTTVADVTPIPDSTVTDTTVSGDSGTADAGNDVTPAEDPGAGDDDTTGDDTGEDPTPQDEDPGSPLSGAVVGVKPDDSGYDVADSSGNVLSLHADDSPEVGDLVKTHIEPLSNGTYDEVGTREVSGSKAKTRLRGVISYLDPFAKLVVISSRGSSLAVDDSVIPAGQTANLQVGTTLEATISITPAGSTGTTGTTGSTGSTGMTGTTGITGDGTGDGSLPDKLIGTTGLAAIVLDVDETPSTRIELNGKLDSVDPVTRLIAVAADSDGIIPADVELTAPKGQDLKKLTKGKGYNVSATVNDDMTLVITGMSPDYDRKSADDSTAAFGDHK